MFLTRSNKRRATALRSEIRDFLRREIGLELSEEKTHITHVRDGFDFLGFRLARERGQGGREVPKIKVGEKALKNIRLRLDESLRYRPQQESLTVRVMRASMVIRGWSEYFRIAHNLSDIAGSLDHHALWAAVKAACRKLDIPSGKCFKTYYRNGIFRISEECRLAQFTGVPMKLDYRGPETYVPGNGVYLEDNECEPRHYFSEKGQYGRMGLADTRWEVLKRDEYTCCKCGVTVNAVTGCVDHIVPVKRFANHQMSHCMSNLQTLCQLCHKEKPRRERTA